MNPVTVYIQGTCFSGSIIAMLAKYGGQTFKRAQSVESADMILYTGGADISPQLYGQPTMVGTSVHHEQDKSDGDTFRRARKTNKLQVGICRGAQFLNVMNGGSMWQDVDNHAGPNHLVTDVLSKKVFEVSSLHHQGIILEPKTAQLLAYCNESEKKRSPDGIWISGLKSPSVDVEAFWYEESRCLGVQWHPECGPQECIDWFFHYIETFGELNSKDKAA